MPPSKAEYRIFSASADPLGEERYPLALVHWDGKELRYAARDRVPSALEKEERALARVLRAMRRRVRELPSPQLDVGLDAMFDVRAGDAGATAWSTKRIAMTRDAADHFARLVADLHLAQLRDAASSIGRAEVVDAVHDLGTLLAKTHANVHPDHTVHEFDQLRSPMSWMNGSWVHTVPLVVSSTSGAHEGVRKVAATLELAVPREHRLVVAYPMPADDSIGRELLRGVAHLATNNPPIDGKTPRVRGVALALTADDEIDTSALQALVLAELRSAA